MSTTRGMAATDSSTKILSSLTGKKPNGVIIFCHGSGDTGVGVKSYVESVAPSHSLELLHQAGIELVYPSATIRPYRLAGGYPSSVWFDRIGGMEPTHPEDTESVLSSTTQLNTIIDALIKEQGLEPHKIAIGGFSMGGGIALQTVVRRTVPSLGAVFTLSSYLCNDSQVYKLLEQTNNNNEQQSCQTTDETTRTNNHNNNCLRGTPLFMAHGTADDFVSLEWGKGTFRRLEQLGVSKIQPFIGIPYAGHEMTSQELEQLFEFLVHELTNS